MPPTHYGFVCAHDLITYRSRGLLEQVYSLDQGLHYEARDPWAHCWHTDWLARWHIRACFYYHHLTTTPTNRRSLCSIGEMTALAPISGTFPHFGQFFSARNQVEFHM